MSRAQLPAAAKAIGEAKSLALACHVGPDGDALGSMLGLGIAASNAGKSVVASFGSPFSLPGNLSFLPTSLLVSPAEFPDEPEVMVVFDAGSADRLGELASNAKHAETVVVLDHHVTNGGFGDIAVVDPESAATGELVVEVLDLLGWEITPDIALCLHTSIVTDTGRFQYRNTRPETFQLGARLVEAGADTVTISQKIYEEVPFGYLKAAGAALSRATLEPELSMVSTVLSHSDLESAGIDWGDIDNLINTVRMAEEADVAVIAKDYGDGRVKLSLRSRGATDVGSLAASLGGGGHRLAAGFTFTGAPDDAITAVREAVGKYR